MIFSLLLPLLAPTSVAALTPPDVSGLPPSRIEQPASGRQRTEEPKRKPAQEPLQAAAPDRLQLCLQLAQTKPAEAVTAAGDWLSESKAAAKAQPYQCMGAALGQSGSWDEAEYAFLQARESMPVGETVQRARYAAMAGNAALADARYDTAIKDLDLAKADAGTAPDATLIGGIELDRARALANLGRLPETRSALDAARQALPNNPDAWLLSATLARRENRLPDAQRYIEKAAELRPVDLEIGLEAGVIAMLSGNEQAARKSWKSVVDADPSSPEAQTAQSYIAQLDKP